MKETEGFDLVHYCNKIFVPERLRKRVLDWYHELLCHPGINQMRKSILSLCVCPRHMRRSIYFQDVPTLSIIQMQTKEVWSAAS